MRWRLVTSVLGVQLLPQHLSAFAPEIDPGAREHHDVGHSEKEMLVFQFGEQHQVMRDVRMNLA